MSASPLKEQLTNAMKDAMRAKDKERLGTIRLALSEVKRVEVDERIDPDDARILSILDKMVKQRRDSIAQFSDAGRTELADKEQAEINVLQDFLPSQLSEEEIQTLVNEAVASTGASSMQDMGKVMGQVKPQVVGRADMQVVSKIVKDSLN